MKRYAKYLVKYIEGTVAQRIMLDTRRQAFVYLQERSIFYLTKVRIQA